MLELPSSSILNCYKNTWASPCPLLYGTIRGWLKETCWPGADTIGKHAMRQRKDILAQIAQAQIRTVTFGDESWFASC